MSAAAAIFTTLTGCSSSTHTQASTPPGIVSQIDRSVTPAKIAGNPNKYIGKVVRLYCTIVDVPDPTVANASCSSTFKTPELPDAANVDYSDARAVSAYELSVGAAMQASAQSTAEEADLVIRGDVGQLDARQKVKIVGTVATPMSGKTKLGVDSKFPTVDAASITNPIDLAKSVVETQRHCIDGLRRLLGQMKPVAPDASAAELNRAMEHFLDTAMGGVLDCDERNGLYALDGAEVSHWMNSADGKKHPTSLGTDPSILSEKPTSEDERVKYQGACMNRLRTFLPAYIKSEGLEVARAAGATLKTIDDCDRDAGFAAFSGDEMGRLLGRIMRMNLKT